MTYFINKTEARAIARADLTIFNETQALMKQVITDASNGLYETTISDGTTMTESTPVITITGSVSNPTVTPGNSIIIGATNRGLDSNSNAGDNKSDYFISVYNKNGAKQSTNQYGVLKNDIGYGIALDNAGNTYITGSSENSIDGEAHSGKKDIFLIKFDSSCY